MQKVEDGSGVLAQRIEDVSGPVMQKAEEVSGALAQRIEDASGPVMQKAEEVSGALAQRVEDASGPVMQKAEDVSEVLVHGIEHVTGALVQKASAAIDSWQDQPAQTRAEPSHAIVPGVDALAASLVERRASPSLSNAERSKTLNTGQDSTAAALIEPNPAPAIATDSERSRTLRMAPDVPTRGLFGVGDRLKVAFYERVDVEENKWVDASSASAMSGFLPRPELSGEYTVQEDGTISVPLLGSIPVAERSGQQVQADLAETFAQVLGRKGLVNILSLERSPIYVLGPVKNPGSFKYAPGMTILHAIALAGGLNQGESEPWQKIEAVRETEKRSGAIDAMVKLLARTAVLEAERDGTAPKIPSQLLELAGAIQAASLVNEQSDRRSAVAMARKYRERATLAALEAAKQDVVAYGHMESLDELVKLRQERVNSMRTLVNRQVLSTTMIDQAQSELSDAEQRRQDARNQYATAKQRVASLEAEVLQTRADLRHDLEVEIETTESQIAANVRELNASEGVLYTLPVTRAQFAAQFATDANRVTYQIVRQSPTGPISIESAGMTLLRPGDLVNIIVGESQPRGPVGSPIPTSSPEGDTLPAENTLNDVGHGRVLADQMMIGPN
ncbi:polysaccharide biosynthesis/export family protein [Mesorhizobium sp. VK22B]|uniref:Polysaccharide biosynthesis/export family protein n=1 Tax=Mesorhizobium captivum TaxID=3072319 RepID=A0ABU4Z1I4_9HYPH|nr:MULTISPECIES: polysaccharide biosynthesis/export family protein [unclassified Mesorhizobium]MDX8493054.1 polysaccharide biosynthesis/export family protein [Mesorhizobium sp. VK22B]MDX8507700.1 polysaccharide biosynthesis/export family protein [Mesorhizobium sp. VK22E]